MSDRAVQKRRAIPLHYNIWWRFLRFFCWVWFASCYRFKHTGRSRIPRHGKGAVMYVSNHQSFLDPIIVGLGTNQPFFALARKTLFKHPVFAWLIRSLSAIPVDQEAVGDKGAMKACIEVLKNAQPLLIFPEGSRTLDGTTQAFAPGTMLLIRRAKPVVVPVAIEGAFEAWPRGGGLRKTGRIRVAFGDPIESDELLAMDSVDALKMLEEKIEAMRLTLVN